MKRAIATWAVVGIVVAATFLIAGTWKWWNAWVFFGCVMGLGALTASALRRSPGLAEERRTAAPRAKPWDPPLVQLINLGLPLVLIVAAIDFRLQISSVPTILSLAALAGIGLAAGLTWSAVASNPFFSSHVRIQEDRGHVVVMSGPYRIVRHPGYAGSTLYSLLVPVLLGSWVALIPACALVVLLIYRTRREDAVLLDELPGYASYASQTRHRLIPGVW